MIVDVDIFESAAVADLRGFAQRASDMRPAMGEVRPLMMEGIRRQFESHGNYLGTPWPALSYETVRRKSREGKSPELMVDQGYLSTSLTGGPGMVSRVTRTMARVGVQDFVARFHQRGASGGRRGDMPARPVVGISDTGQELAMLIIRRFLIGGI